MAEVDKIVEKEDRSKSYIIIAALREYIKAHGNGNPAYALESFNDKELKAYPTAWGSMGRAELAPYDSTDLLEMRAKIRSVGETLDIIYQEKRTEERAKRIKELSK